MTVKSPELAFQPFQRHCGHHIGSLCSLGQSIYCQSSQGCGRSGAVNKGQTFLIAEGQRLHTGFFQGFFCRQQFSLVPGLSFSYKHCGDMGLHTQIAYRSFTRHIRDQILVQEIPVSFQDFHTDSADASAKALENHQHHCPHFFLC